MKLLFMAAAVNSFYFASAVPSQDSRLLLAAEISSHIRQALADDQRHQTVVMVYLKERANLSGAENMIVKADKTRFVHGKLLEIAKRTQEGLVQLLKQRGLFFRRFYITNAIAIYNPSLELLEEISKRTEVDRLSLDPHIARDKTKKTVVPETQSVGGIEPALRSIGVDKVWSELGVKGRGIVIGGQDTGVQFDHPALVRQYRGRNANGSFDHDYNWLDAIFKRTNKSSKNKCGYATSEPCDDGEHGTHTLGTIVGDDAKGNQIGLAPEAQWIACRNMDDGDGRPSLYIDCFQFFMAPYKIGGDPFTDGDPSKAAHIINNSWGCPESEGCEGWEMDEVLKAMKAAGILVVVSAGNEGPSCATMSAQPASHGLSALSVGAYDHRFDRIAYFSSRGPTTFDQQVGPDVVAPGVSIRSSVPNNRYEGGWMGTSMAGPHVAGVAALMWSANPALIGQVDTTIEIIRRTATPKESSQECGGVSGKAIPNAVFGYGVVNAYEAVRSALAR